MISLSPTVANIELIIKEHVKRGKWFVCGGTTAQQAPGSGWSVAPGYLGGTVLWRLGLVKVGFTLVELQDDQNKTSSQGPLWNSIPRRFLTGAGVSPPGER